MLHRYWTYGLLAASLALSAVSAHADDAFYKGKTITITTSTGPGGTYDLIARLLSRYMGRYIDGHPQIIVQNMPGGGNVLATNYMYNIAPKDGTAICVINNAIPLHQVIDNRGVRYDASKFQWIGSTGAKNEVVFAWKSTGVKNVDDARKKELVVGGTGPGSSIVIIPTVMNNVLGTKFKIVNGYKSSNDVFLAMERGEVQARDGSYASLVTGYPSWIKDNKLVFLAQEGLKRDKALPDVPLLTELARTDEQRAILKLISSPSALGQPYLAPPQTPVDRVAVLRKAFADTMGDKEFLAGAKKLDFDIDLIGGEELSQIVNDTVQASPEIVEKARAAMEPAAGAEVKKKSKK
jgi:tripartite-type tricarboxylate transporter receptor subunit TctC